MTQGNNSFKNWQPLENLYGPLAQHSPEHTQVIAQLGQSLDGRIATVTGHSHFVTGTADRRHLHQLRALCDAVLIGPGTLLSDNPQLTVREVPGDNPLRVVMAPRGPLPINAAVFSDHAAATLLLLPPDYSGSVPAHVEVLQPSPYSPAGILAALGQHGVRRLLIEGGAKTVSSWLAADLIDWLYITVAPVIIGAGPTGLALPAIDHMDEARRYPVERFLLGDDVLFRLDCRGGA